MRKIIFLCLSLLVNLSGVMAQNDAMFVYRNDGAINAFLNADVDSMRCSHIGLDSVEYKDYVVQEVWTVDSVYRIPLEVIDSVSFVTPPTIYKEGVVNLKEQLSDYVIGADDLTLKLKVNVPTELIPSIGDKLVMIEGCEALPYGFSGVVSSVQAVDKEINVYCEQTCLEDLFDSFCSVTTVYGVVGDNGAKRMYALKNGTNQRSVSTSKDATLSIGTLTVDCSTEFSSSILPNSDLAVSGATGVSVSISPTFRIHTFLLVGKGHGVYFNGSITGNVEIASEFSAYGSINYSHDFEKKSDEVSFSVPFTAKLVNFYVVPGMFVQADATIAETAKDVHNYTFGMAFDYSNRGENIMKSFIATPRLVSSSIDVTGCIDGSLAVGGFIETGFKLVSRDFFKACARGKLGWKVKGNFVLRNSDVDIAEKDTKLYNRLKSSSVETGPFASVSLETSALRGVWTENTTLLSAELMKKWDIVPTFSKTTLSHTDGSLSALTANSEVSGNCLSPVTIGYKLYDEEMNEISDIVVEDKFKNGRYGLKHTFYDIDLNKKYLIYPKVKLFNIDILASPKATFSFLCPDSNHPHAIDLGMPSGKKWACCNVDADAPEEYGGYYAWGDVETKSTYTLGTYTQKYVENISGTQFDVATKKWGDNWQIPTKEDMEWLTKNCSWVDKTWHGVKGTLIIAPNGNSIFLPYSDLVASDRSYGMGGCCYWTGTQDLLYAKEEDKPYSLFMPIATEVKTVWSVYYLAHYGMLIRPIWSTK